MTREGLTSTSDSFRLTVQRPLDDARSVLEGTVELAANAKASSVKVSLALFAHFQQRVGHTGIAGEAPIAGRSTTVALTGADEPVAFGIELPAVARASSGPHLRIEPGIIATSDDGETLRVVLPSAWLDDGEHPLKASGVPRTVSTMSPRLYVFALAVTAIVAGGALVGAGASMDAAPMYQGGSALVLVGAITALVTRRGALGWLRVGEASVTLEDGDDRQLRVRVRAGPRATGGRVLLRAVEFEAHEGTNDDLGELDLREAPLSREGGNSGELVATVALPSTRAAPPSLALRSAGRTVGIRWSVVVELTTRGGSVARFDVPVSMSIAHSSSRNFSTAVA